MQFGSRAKHFLKNKDKKRIAVTAAIFVAKLCFIVQLGGEEHFEGVYYSK
jgi:hypothetical protein